MQLLDIDDPLEKKTELSFEHAIGIDLGTTNSVCAYCHDDAIKMVKFNGQALIPSIVTYKDGKITIGNKALDKNSITFESIKRLMGKGMDDLGDDYERFKGLIDHSKDNTHIIHLKLDNHSITPIELSAHILTKIKQLAIKELAITDISKCVITVPAYFDDAARNATIQAAKISALEVLRLINEPTAAALAYGLDMQAEGFYGIYDLGGGTFDTSIVEMKQGVFRVIATGGDNQLGGDDFDFKVTDFFIEKYFSEYSFEDLTHKEITQLMRVARHAKIYLSDNDKFSDHVIIRDKDYQLSITITEFEDLITNLIDESTQLFASTLKAADIKIQDLEEIILVGGATKVPLVPRRIQEVFNKKPLTKIDPELIVSYGAAIQANALCNGSNNLLIDVIPLSLGIETMGGLVEKIIPRNTPIPVSITKEFTTHKNNQKNLLIHILQGEREIVNQNRSLAHFELADMPLMPAGKPRIQITFKIDRDGILTISASEQTTGKQQIIEVQPTYGLNISQIEKMLQDSYVNAKQDMLTRQLNKFKFQIDEHINSLKSIISKDFDLFDKSEIGKIENEIKKLSEDFKSCHDLAGVSVLHDNSKELLTKLIHDKIEKISHSLSGKTLEELEKIMHKENSSNEDNNND
ncbi:MAG: Fe-S protein assembly chaperone HscA [Rickettsiales bacterium]|jgi:molecular chaperone HscA|nr:Fe-S protein assembly chaperone HscA [Rickettsiales bacterium]